MPKVLPSGGISVREMRRIVLGAAIGAGVAVVGAIGATLDALRKLDA
jgi:hypothetical protein